MTQIHQNSLPGHHAVDDASHSISERSGHNAPGRQVLDGSARNGAHESASGTVNISFNAHMRLRAYQDQKKLPDSLNSTSPVIESTDSIKAGSIDIDLVKDALADGMSQKSDQERDDIPEQIKRETAQNDLGSINFSEHITEMLFEVQNNIVQASEPGYRYLVNMLNNYDSVVEDPQQLQEIMRKEEFFLSRRKPFMESADFQSYSQVLNQFSNIVERQQFI